MADISEIKLPSGSTYKFKDEQARNDIASRLNGFQIYQGSTLVGKAYAATDGTNRGVIELYNESGTGVKLYGLHDTTGEIDVLYGGDTIAALFGSTNQRGCLRLYNSDGTYVTYTGDAATTIYNLNIYPVGAIYISTVSTSPASLFRGTWEQIKDRFLLAAGDTYTAGNTGGEAAHTLTSSEMPWHSHQIGYREVYALTGEGDGALAYDSSAKTYNRNTSYVGSGTAHNNMPPYLVVYVWKRIG